MKVIVAGSRKFNDYKKLCETLNRLLCRYNLSEVEIVSGGANGADKLGERYAKDKGCLLKVYPAEWDVYGKSAGYRRNVQMAEYANSCVVFWDGKSKGTKHMIDIAEKHKLNLRKVMV
ncbi:TPA: DUF2493 domain-containing protein [Bacillus cereus]